MLPSHQVSLWRTSSTINLRMLQLGGVKIAFTWQKPGMLLTILQCSLAPTTESHLAECQRWLGVRSCFRLLEGSRTRLCEALCDLPYRLSKLFLLCYSNKCNSTTLKQNFKFIDKITHKHNSSYCIMLYTKYS